MTISKITSKSITDSTITSDDIATGAVESSMTTQIGGRRNLIINGAMQVAQRGTSFSAAGYNLDRFAQDSGRTNTVEQSTDSPEGFTYSHKTSGGTQARNTWTSIELPSAGSSGLFYEGSTFTLSFYAKDTGSQSMTLAIQFSDSGTSLTNAVSIASSSVSLTTGWVRYDYTFTVGSGVTPAGTNDCVVVRFTVADTSDTVYITGVQLEVGTVATPFEHRSYGEELALCQRYYERWARSGNLMVTMGHTFSVGASYGVVNYKTKRAEPDCTSSTGLWRIRVGGVGNNETTATLTFANINIDTARVLYSGNGTSAGVTGWIVANHDAYVEFDAEL